MVVESSTKDDEIEVDIKCAMSKCESWIYVQKNGNETIFHQWCKEHFDEKNP